MAVQGRISKNRILQSTLFTWPRFMLYIEAYYLVNFILMDVYGTLETDF